jgi:hypothetical protein
VGISMAATVIASRRTADLDLDLVAATLAKVEHLFPITEVV